MAPWSAIWDHNRFTAGAPRFEAFVESPYARGAVTGIGLVTLVVGVAELGGAVAGRMRKRDPQATPDDAPSQP